MIQSASPLDLLAALQTEAVDSASAPDRDAWRRLLGQALDTERPEGGGAGANPTVPSPPPETAAPELPIELSALLERVARAELPELRSFFDGLVEAIDRAGDRSARIDELLGGLESLSEATSPRAVLVALLEEVAQAGDRSSRIRELFDRLRPSDGGETPVRPGEQGSPVTRAPRDGKAPTPLPPVTEPGGKVETPPAAATPVDPGTSSGSSLTSQPVTPIETAAPPTPTPAAPETPVETAPERERRSPIEQLLRLARHRLDAARADRQDADVPRDAAARADGEARDGADARGPIEARPSRPTVAEPSVPDPDLEGRPQLVTDRPVATARADARGENASVPVREPAGAFERATLPSERPDPATADASARPTDTAPREGRAATDAPVVEPAEPLREVSTPTAVDRAVAGDRITPPQSPETPVAAEQPIRTPSAAAASSAPATATVEPAVAAVDGRTLANERRSAARTYASQTRPDPVPVADAPTASVTNEARPRPLAVRSVQAPTVVTMDPPSDGTAKQADRMPATEVDVTVELDAPATRARPAQGVATAAQTSGDAQPRPAMPQTAPTAAEAVATTAGGEAGATAGRSSGPATPVAVEHRALAEAIVARARALPANGSLEVRFAVDPADIGLVRVRIESRGDELKIRIIASSGAAVETLQAGISRLTSQLTEAGMRDPQIDLGLEDSPGRDAARERDGSASNRPATATSNSAETSDPVPSFSSTQTHGMATLDRTA